MVTLIYITQKTFFFYIYSVFNHGPFISVSYFLYNKEIKFFRQSHLYWVCVKFTSCLSHSFSRFSRSVSCPRVWIACLRQLISHWHCRTCICKSIISIWKECPGYKMHHKSFFSKCTYGKCLACVLVLVTKHCIDFIPSDCYG